MSDYLQDKWIDIPPNFSVNGLSCHREVLENIDYFKGLLGGNYREKAAAEVTLNDVDPTTVKFLLRYAYTRSIDPAASLLGFQMTFTQCLELYQFAEFLCYTALKVKAIEYMRCLNLTDADTPTVLGHLGQETDVDFRDWLIQRCMSDSIRWRLDVASWPREYLLIFVDSSLISAGIKLNLILRWLVGQPKPVATEDLRLLERIDLKTISRSHDPSTLTALELVFALNRPEITAMVCRELFYEQTNWSYGHAVEVDWSNFNPKQVQFAAMRPVREGLHRIKMSTSLSRHMELTMPPLRLVSVQATPSDGSYALRMDFPEPRTFNYNQCQQRLVELQEHCCHYLETLKIPELAPFQPNVSKHLIGIIHDSRARPSSEAGPNVVRPSREADSDVARPSTEANPSVTQPSGDAGPNVARPSSEASPNVARPSSEASPSIARPSILARTQEANVRLENSNTTIPLTAVPVPCWIRVTLKLYIAIGTKLSIVRSISHAEVRLTS